MGYIGDLKWWSGEATKVTWVCLVVHGCMYVISLYRVIGVIRVMALHSGVLYGSGDMANSPCDHVCGVLVNVSYSDEAGGRYVGCIYASIPLIQV